MYGYLIQRCLIEKCGAFALKGLTALAITDLERWVKFVSQQVIHGQVAGRIPRLAQADSQWFAVAVCHRTGQFHQLGEIDRSFPLMSVIKPLQLLYLLEHYGADQVFQWVGMDPSDAPFNSIDQLMADDGKPRNPMINSGAIALSDKLPGQNGTDRCQRLCSWLNQQAGCHLKLDELLLASVRSAGREPNQALVRYLTETGSLSDPEIALDTYEQICCLSGTIKDLAVLGNLLAIEGRFISSQHRRIVNAIMLTCGLYEASAVYAVRIGLPMKSGISGALVAVVPDQGTIACYSPALDRMGNSVRGITLMEMLSRELQLSVFG